MTKAEKLIEVIRENFDELVEESLACYRDSIVPGTYFPDWETGIIIDLDGNMRSFYWSPGTTTEGILNGTEVAAVKFAVVPTYPDEDCEDEEEYYDLFTQYYGRDVAEMSIEMTIENLMIDAENEKKQEAERKYSY